jgi:hypothetical protein
MLARPPPIVQYLSVSACINYLQIIFNLLKHFFNTKHLRNQNIFDHLTFRTLYKHFLTQNIFEHKTYRTQNILEH